MTKMQDGLHASRKPQLYTLFMQATDHTLSLQAIRFYLHSSENRQQKLSSEIRSYRAACTANLLLQMRINTRKQHRDKSDSYRLPRLQTDSVKGSTYKGLDRRGKIPKCLHRTKHNSTPTRDASARHQSLLRMTRTSLQFSVPK